MFWLDFPLFRGSMFFFSTVPVTIFRPLWNCLFLMVCIALLWKCTFFNSHSSLFPSKVSCSTVLSLLLSSLCPSSSSSLTQAQLCSALNVTALIYIIYTGRPAAITTLLSSMLLHWLDMDDMLHLILGFLGQVGWISQFWDAFILFSYLSKKITWPQCWAPKTYAKKRKLR